MPGHQLNECKYPRGCHNCGGRHHQSICFRSRAPIQNEATNEEPSGLGSTTTQLNTATANASDCNRNRYKRRSVEISRSENLLDNGSQRSYVTDNLKSKLGLKSTSTKTLCLNTFGETAYRNQRCQVITLPLRINNNAYV